MRCMYVCMYIHMYVEWRVNRMLVWRARAFIIHLIIVQVCIVFIPEYRTIANIQRRQLHSLLLCHLLRPPTCGRAHNPDEHERKRSCVLRIIEKKHLFIFIRLVDYRSTIRSIFRMVPLDLFIRTIRSVMIWMAPLEAPDPFDPCLFLITPLKPF